MLIFRATHGTSAFIIYISTLLTTTILSSNTCYAESFIQEHFIISSGTSGGNYNEAATLLAESLNQIDSNHYVFKTIVSNGSIENIKRLKDRSSDFAIVQRDVFVRNYYGDGDKIKNISIISPLFQEKFLIYTHNNSLISFEEFKASVNSSLTTIKIGLTSINGSSYKTFSEIASLLGLNKDNVEFVINDYKKLSRKFSSGEIDYVITFSLPIKEINNAQKVYFDDNDIKLLTRRMRHLTTANLDNKEHKTLGVWALFVGLNSSISQIGEDAIAKRILQSKINDSYISNQIKNTLNEFRTNATLYNQYLNELPVIASFQNITNQNDSPAEIYFFILIALATSIFIIFYSLFHHTSIKRRKYLWVRYKHIFIGLLLVSIVYLLCMEWLIFSEDRLYKETGIKSSVLDITRTDLHIWNLVRTFANNDGGMFPISVTGKLAATLSMYVIFIGSISIAIIEFVTHKLIAKRREGLMSIKHEEHIIIAGWNDNTPKLIEELLRACKEYHKKALKIVCVVADPKLVLEKHSLISELEHRKELILIKGYIRSKNILEQCNARKASIIILLAEEAGTHADEKTLMRALGIRKFCCEDDQPSNDLSYITIPENRITSSKAELFQTKAKVNPVYIIAEVNTEEFVSDLYDAGVNGVINKNKIADGLLVQSILNPGVSTLVHNILTFSGDTNEFYTVDLMNPNNSHLRRRTFDELLLPLRKKNILLIAIKVVYRDRAGNEIIDKDELSRLLNHEGLYRQIITNPITSEETNRKTDTDDQLITLAVSADMLNIGLREVVFD